MSTLSMINGQNTDVIYQGMTFHVQTEDMGIKNGYFQIQIYYHGKILSSQRHDYKDLIDHEDNAHALQKRITHEHSKAIKQVKEGRINIADLDPILNSPGRSDKKSGKIKIVSKAGRFMKKHLQPKSTFETSSEETFELKKGIKEAFWSRKKRFWVTASVGLASILLVSMVHLSNKEDEPSRVIQFDLFAQQGDALMKDGQLERAEEAYGRALAIFPNRSPIYIKRAKLFEMSGAITRAISELSKALELDNANGELYFKRGILQIEKGDHNKAVQDFKSAIDSNFDNDEIYTSLGMALFQTGDYKAAEKSWSRSLKANPNNPEIHNHMGLLAVKRESYGQAILHFQTAIDIDPSIIEAYIHLGDTYSATGLKDKAADYWGKALALDPENNLAHSRLNTLK